MLALGLYSVCALHPSSAIMKGPSQFGFSLPSLKVRQRTRSPLGYWLDKFPPLTKGSMVVLGHSYGCSISFLLELVQCLGKLRGLTCT